MIATALRMKLAGLLLLGGLLAAGSSEADESQKAASSRLTGAVVAGGEDTGQTSEAPEIAVIQGLTQAELAPLAPGYLEWMRQRLAEAGLEVARGTSSRLSPDELALRPDRSTTTGRLLHAVRARAAKTLLVDLRRNSQGLEIGLRLASLINQLPTTACRLSNLELCPRISTSSRFLSP